MTSATLHRLRQRLGLRRPDFAAEDAALRELDAQRELADPRTFARIANAAVVPFRRRNLVPLIWLALLGWAILGAFTAANYAVFRALGEDYFRWYLENGALVAIALAFVSALLDLDREPGLIGAHPFEYAGAWFTILAQVSYAWAAVFEPQVPESTRHRSIRFDTVLSAVVSALYAAALLGYTIVVAPLQYWLNLFVGAPARSAAGSSVRSIVERRGRHTVITFAPRDGTVSDEADGSVQRDETGFGRRPVTATATVSAGVLLLVSRLV